MRKTDMTNEALIARLQMLDAKRTDAYRLQEAIDKEARDLLAHLRRRPGRALPIGPNRKAAVTIRMDYTVDVGLYRCLAAEQNSGRIAQAMDAVQQVVSLADCRKYLGKRWAEACPNPQPGAEFISFTSTRAEGRIKRRRKASPKRIARRLLGLK